MKIALLLLTTAGLLCGCAPSQRNGLDNTGPLAVNPSPPTTNPASAMPPEPFIYVRGEFRAPGRYAWTNGMTLQDAFAAAGGFTVFALPHILIHHADGSSQRFKWSDAHPLTNNPSLKPGDHIENWRE